jgi:hypothetical protein
VEGFTNVIENGSFEIPGELWPPLTPLHCPADWNDFNLPSRFYSQVFSDWASDGTYSLTIYSRTGYRVFEVNEIGMISQHVPLTREVNEIIFDIQLRTSSGGWDPNIRRAVVCIDGEVVWESNDVGPDVRGVYYDQNFVVPETYKDGQPHKLSLGIRIDSNTPTTNIAYYTDWDYVDSTTYCGGLGLLAADLNRDCYVDFFDLKMLADVWLEEVQPNDERNLFGDDDLDPNGVINFFDFTVLTEDWLYSSYDE